MKDDLSIIEEIKNNKNTKENLLELTTRHSGIFYEKVNQFMKHPSFGNTTGLLKEDLLLERDYIIYQAAISFNKEKGVKFSTWLGNSTFYYLHTLYNNNKNEVIVDEMPEIVSDDEERAQNAEYVEKIKEYISKLDLRVQEIFNLRYFSRINGKLTPYHVIGKKMGLSHERVRGIHDEVIRNLQSVFKDE